MPPTAIYSHCSCWVFGSSTLELVDFSNQHSAVGGFSFGEVDNILRQSTAFIRQCLWVHVLGRIQRSTSCSSKSSRMREVGMKQGAWMEARRKGGKDYGIWAEIFRWRLEVNDGVTRDRWQALRRLWMKLRKIQPWLESLWGISFRPLRHLKALMYLNTFERARFEPEFGVQLSLDWRRKDAVCATRHSSLFWKLDFLFRGTIFAEAFIL